MGSCEANRNKPKNINTKESSKSIEQINSYQSSQNFIQTNIANKRIQDNIIKQYNESEIIKGSNISKKICKIKIETQIGNDLKTKIFTGFFLKFNIDQEIFECLVSNAHVITNELIDKNKIIYISYDNEMKGTSIKLNRKKRYIKNFKDNGLDTTVVEIKEDDNVLADYFLFPNEESIIYDNLINSKIFITNFNNEGELINKEGIIKNINNYEFTFLVNKSIGSSGCPIFLENTSEVIGIYKERKYDNSENYADFIYPAINIIREDKRINKGKYISGKYLYEDGKYYEGELKNNIPNGRGIKYLSNGKIIYEGDFIDGKFQGNGKYIYDNGELYLGQWKNGFRNGKGTYCYKNGNIMYIGDWINDKYEGTGRYILENGEFYVGQWKNGFRNGKGTYCYNNGNIMYVGDWVNDKYEGTGKYIWENGEFYIGQWKNGLKHGKGTLYFKDGNVMYEGYYINDSAARIKEEFDSLVNNPIINCGVEVALIKKGDYSRWKASIMGAKDTSYRGGIFFLLIEFPPTYPINPPKICFLTPIYHVNINPKKPKFPYFYPLGYVSLPTLNLWKPNYTMREIFTNLFGLFYIGNSESPFSLEMDDELKYNRNLYEEKIEYFTKKYAGSVDYEKYLTRDNDWDFTYP